MGIFSKLPDERKYEISGIILFAIASIIFVGLALDLNQGDSHRSISDLGANGSILADILYVGLGNAAHLIYMLIAAWGVMMMRHQPVDRFLSRFLGAVMLIVFTAGLFDVLFESKVAPGGAIGSFVTSLTTNKNLLDIGVIGSVVVDLTLASVGLLLSTEFLFIRLIHGAYNTFVLTIASIDELRRKFMTHRTKAKAERPQKVITVKAKEKKEKKEPRLTVRQMVQWAMAQLTTRRNKVRKAVEAVRKNHVDEESVQDQNVDLSRMRVSSTGTKTEEFAALAQLNAPVEDLVSDVADESAASEPMGQLEIAPETLGELVSAPAVPAPPKTPGTSRLRRKSVDEELPEDYVYPKSYTKPSMDMLEEAPEVVQHDLTNKLRETGFKLEETLKTFGIEAQVTDITRGPTLTRFELEPASGIKVSRFVALTDDLALALKAHGIRVEAPIPGKGKVGIEIPNEEGEAVMLRELLTSKQFIKNKGPLALALGKDIAGEVMVGDVATMPHLLIAGATGAGKTVCVKTILASLLMSKTPDELQLMLIDPKMVELSIFNDIPHLMTPVVIDPKKAATSLNWLINEMEERYKLFAHLRVRNIEVYNESVDNGEIEVESDEEEEAENVQSIRKLPYIVCIIDELADLMMLARADVEDAIARLAQLARAVGIHLIIATQRPSVDVLTGVIKANFPSRISFQVSSRVDSRCILDEIGAERLIGRGDMLYLPPGYAKPIRIQGAFVSDDDMHGLIAYLKSQAPPQYRDEIENFGKSKETVVDLSEETDDLFDDAVQIVMDTGQASISMVQRRLRVGYTRAARLIDMMEVKGIVGPHMGSKAREILVPGSNHDEVA
jgi:S-DNA-T family DNA segregation ATPase FtsK/SpoIIIE